MAKVRVISGFQTGADRGGIHAAYDLKQAGYPVDVGGWIPRDRRAQDGQISMDDVVKYGLSIHPGNGYPPRTEQNVVDSNGTVLFGNMNSPGCRLTQKCCVRHLKPFLRNCTDPVKMAAWIRAFNIEVLNIAGNREETNPGIYQVTFDIVTAALLEILQ